MSIRISNPALVMYCVQIQSQGHETLSLSKEMLVITSRVNLDTTTQVRTCFLIFQTCPKYYPDQPFPNYFFSNFIPFPTFLVIHRISKYSVIKFSLPTPERVWFAISNFHFSKASFFLTANT